jgi:hypothetical protein
VYLGISLPGLPFVMGRRRMSAFADGLGTTINEFAGDDVLLPN